MALVLATLPTARPEIVVLSSAALANPRRVRVAGPADPGTSTPSTPTPARDAAAPSLASGYWV